MEPEQIIAKIVRWGRKSPHKIKKWGNGRQNSRATPKTDQALLVEQAMAFGYLNGKRLPGRQK
jgi:hypothetical protein